MFDGQPPGGKINAVPFQAQHLAAAETIQGGDLDKGIDRVVTDRVKQSFELDGVVIAGLIALLLRKLNELTRSRLKDAIFYGFIQGLVDDIFVLPQGGRGQTAFDSDTTADTYVYISNVLPAGITEADLPEFAARGFDGGFASRIVCHYNSDRVNALTKEAFEQFFIDNPAYLVEQYFLIYNDNPSAIEEGTAGRETDAQNVPESVEETLFSPEPAGKDADLRIEYENGIISARRPHFTNSDGIVTMQFNAIDWYCVRVIRIEDVEEYFPDEKMLAQSSNLKVFQSYENQEFEYSCVFVPYDDSDFAFLFETDISPEAMDFGFSDCIHYYAGGRRSISRYGAGQECI